MAAESTCCCAVSSSREGECSAAENRWTSQQQNPAHDHHRTCYRSVTSRHTLYFLDVVPTRFATGPGTSAMLPPWNNAGIEGVYANNPPGGLFVGRRPLGAFQLNGEHSPVPEPGTILLIAGGAGLVAHRVRRRRGI